ncbi:MAG: AI-2E family transporter, partial [Anaerolineales bacterium]
MKTEWKTTTRYIVAIGLFLFALVVIYLSSPVIPMLIIASLIALLVTPIINWLCERFRFPRGLSVLVTFLLVAVVIILAPLILIPPIINAVNFLLNLDYETLFTNVLVWIETSLRAVKADGFRVLGLRLILDSMIDPILNVIEGADSIVTPELPSLTAIIPSIGQAFAFSYGFAVEFVGTVFSGFVAFLFLIISSIYLSVDGDRLVGGFVRSVPKTYRVEVEQLLDRLRGVWDSFFRGQVTLMVVIGILVWLGLTILGLPGAFALGIIAGLLEIIPNLGPLLAAIPAVIVALLQGSDTLAVNNFIFTLIIIGFYVVVNFFENTVVVPRVMSESVKLHPLVVILGVLIGASTWGILGALLAAPVIASSREIFSYLYRHVIGEDPFPPPKPEPDNMDISLGTKIGEIKERAGELIQHIPGVDTESRVDTESHVDAESLLDTGSA